MTVKFNTIGNATLIVYENNHPLIATDPWFDTDPAYFGSWRLSHKFPAKQREAIQKSKYIFISHPHPDHLNLMSLRHCKQSTIIIAQHYGSRIERELRKIGFSVITFPSKKWISIGKYTRVLLFNNELQDSALLVELTDNVGEKSLILNLNDTGGIGFEKESASISAKYKNSIYLQLHCWGDADMINLFDSKGDRIPPKAAKKFPVGRDIKAGMKRFNANIAIPFSNLHQYQRRDSFWANDYVTPLNLMGQGFSSDKNHILLPPFQEVEMKDGTFLANDIKPEKLEIIEPVHESIFGDDWKAVLNKREEKECKEYFQSINTLFKNHASIILNVGGIRHEMLYKGKGRTKIIFSVPKNSLLKAIREQIFDDLLIGNFMKTQIINSKSLYDPDFTLTVAKYSDNGRVNTQNELEKYFNYYNHQRSNNDRIAVYMNNLLKRVINMIDTNTLTKIKYMIRR